ncbi:MAG: histidinol-phosphate transaminase [Crocinitomicaceae bacterium]|nr:histidinol-phosphate transaminase [Crocinitomicaceae bacterium]
MFDLDKIVRPNIRQLKPYSSARDEFSGSEGIFLDANENPFGQLNRYPDPYQRILKDKIAELKGVVPSKIFVGNGSDEIIDLAFRIFCEPGKDKVLTFTPTYGMYDVSANINNVEVESMPLTPSFEIDLNALRSKLEFGQYRIIFICSPNNPTGNSISTSVIEEIFEKTEGIVIVDEAYIDFSENDSTIKLIQKYSNLIVMQTLSKAWGLAGVRVGLGFANEKIINLFNKVKPPYNVSQLNQEAALKAINNLSKYEEQVATLLKEKEFLLKELGKLESIKKIYPSDTNFLLVEMEDADQTYTRLVEEKIIVRNRNQQVKNCIRITVGTKNENEVLIKTLKTIENEK